MTTIKEINEEFDEIYKKNGLDELTGVFVFLGGIALFCYNLFYRDYYSDKVGIVDKWIVPIFTSFIASGFTTVIAILFVYGVVLTWSFYFRNKNK